MILLYKGKSVYTDPQNRFEVHKDEYIDFTDEEAEKILNDHPKLFSKVGE